MFRTLTSSLTIIALLAHALLGCCWHHRHEHGDHAAVCDAHEHEQHAAEEEHSHSHARHAHSGCHEHDSPVCMHTGPCSHHHTCTGLACSYLAAKVLKVQGLESRGFLSQPNGPTDVDPALAHSRNLGPEAIMPGPDSSVSRCALLQTWQV